MRKIALVRHEGSHLQALFLLAFSFIFGRGGEKKKKNPTKWKILGYFEMCYLNIILLILAGGKYSLMWIFL